MAIVLQFTKTLATAIIDGVTFSKLMGRIGCSTNVTLDAITRNVGNEAFAIKIVAGVVLVVVVVVVVVVC
jgi:hypothetical protein